MAGRVAGGVAGGTKPSDKTGALSSPPPRETTVSEQKALPTLWDFLKCCNHFKHVLFSDF